MKRFRSRWSTNAGQSGLLALTLTLVAALCTPGSAEAQRDRAPDGVVTGRVIDGATGEPLAGVEIGLDDDAILAITDEAGSFSIDRVAGGNYLLWARRLGYGERSDSLRVPPRALLDVTLTLSTEPIDLGELVVVVRSRVLVTRGFYERQEQGYRGTFIDRVEIEKQRPQAVTDLFRNVPGVRVVYGGLYGARIFVNQRVTFRDDGLPGCEPGLWLDGIRSTMNSYDLMRAEEIEGIEVYPGGSAPGKFNNIGGTVVIWTRLPIR